MLKNFDELKTMVSGKDKKYRCVVVGADDAHALSSVFALEKEGIIKPILVGNKERTENLLKELEFSSRNYSLVPCTEGENPAEVGVALIKAGEGDFLLKGRMQTKDVLRPVLNKEKGLNAAGFMVHFGLIELKNYHKLLAISDSAVIPHPTLEDKKKIAELGIKTLEKLGRKEPVVAALCGVENAGEKMPETMDALALSKLSEEGYFGAGRVIGPISFDLAMDREAAEVKGYNSPFSGNIDMFMVPQMVTGNVMTKMWSMEEGNIAAGCVIGSDVPIAMTSRSASTEEKLNSLLLCCALA